MMLSLKVVLLYIVKLLNNQVPFPQENTPKTPDVVATAA
jgi:hypothetical protein